MPTVTVAICTRGRRRELRRLLRALEPQVCAPHEVLVIDNAAPADSVLELVRAGFSSVRYVRESVPGLDFARNRALNESGSEVVALIDDDAVPAPDWLEQIVRVFEESPSIAACMGRVGALSQDSPGARLFEANGGFGRGDVRIDLPCDVACRPPGLPRPLIAWSFGVGSGVCMAVRRRVALELGGFDEALDMGAALPGGGDLDMIWRILDRGHRLVYAPSVRAWHEHRRTREAAALQIVEHNRAAMAMLTKAVRNAKGARKLAPIAYLGWRLAKPLVRMILALIGRDVLPIPVLARLVVGNWKGLVAYPAARKLAAERKAAHGLQ